jgi:hypothetical protein
MIEEQGGYKYRKLIWLLPTLFDNAKLVFNQFGVAAYI